MRKKLKDLTIIEILTICDDTEFRSCMFGKCKIDAICDMFRMYDRDRNISLQDREYLEREIDI